MLAEPLAIFFVIMQQRSDAKIVNHGQCARANLLCKSRAACRRAAWTRRSCRRHAKLPQPPTITLVKEVAVEPLSKDGSHDNIKVKCAELSAPPCAFATIDSATDVVHRRTEEDLDARAEPEQEGGSVDECSATGAAKDVDAEALMDADLESESITDLNTSDASKEQFIKQLVACLQVKKASGNDCSSSFQSVSLPKVSLSSYASRIYKYFRCTDECFVLCLVYIDRIVKLHPHIEVTDFTSHRLFFISALVATKFHDDVYASNDYFARVGGMHPVEVNALEEEFLRLLDWRLCVGPSEYNLYFQTLRGQELL